MTCGPGPGAGTRERNRFVARKAEHGGLECIGHTKQAATCQMCTSVANAATSPEEPEDETIDNPIATSTTEDLEKTDTSKGARARYKRETQPAESDSGVEGETSAETHETSPPRPRCILPCPSKKQAKINLETAKTLFMNFVEG